MSERRKNVKELVMLVLTFIFIIVEAIFSILTVKGIINDIIPSFVAIPVRVTTWQTILLIAMWQYLFRDADTNIRVKELYDKFKIQESRTTKQTCGLMLGRLIRVAIVFAAMKMYIAMYLL